MKHFIVAATGRSATKYTARLLSACGLECGHEQVFAVERPGFHGWDEYLGDASWLSVPYLESLPQEVVLLHQVRNPVMTIRSLATTGIFMPFRPGRHVVMPLVRLLRGKNPFDFYRRFVRKHDRRAWGESHETLRAARHWLNWNARIEAVAASSERPYLRYRVEDLDREVLGKILALLEAPSVGELPQVSRRTNARRSRYAADELVWTDSMRAEVRAAAHRYGYSNSDLDEHLWELSG